MKFCLYYIICTKCGGTHGSPYDPLLGNSLYLTVKYKRHKPNISLLKAWGLRGNLGFPYAKPPTFVIAAVSVLLKYTRVNCCVTNAAVVISLCAELSPYNRVCAVPLTFNISQ